MKTYNVIYNKEIPVGMVRNQLESSGAIVNKMFPRMHVMNISSDTLDFANLSSIVAWEEDVTLTVKPATDYWHKLRLISNQLPMVSKYIPENDGDGVKIYLMDTGINKNLDEFAEADIVDCYTYDGDFSDLVGHGTMMASLMVGKTLGVSVKAQLKNVKVRHGTSSVSELLTAFDAILQDKTNPSEIAVINCSWTIPKSRILDTKITEMQDANFVVVAAAGNDSTDANNYSPVGLDSVLGVGASDAYDRVIKWGTIAGSNWGPDVDLFAPGIDVSVLKLDGTIEEASGTSVAAAVTSAAVAQTIKSLDPAANLTSYHVQFMIVGSAIPDILFRNEAVYGTTPNMLLHIFRYASVIRNLPTEKINVQIGTEYQLTLEVDTRYAVSIDIDDVVLGGTRRTYPEWVSLDKNTNTLKFAPPPSYSPQINRMWIKAVNAAGETVQMGSLMVNCYMLSPNENDSKEAYGYVIENDVTFLKLATCTPSCLITCAADPPKGFSCGCATGNCYTL